AGRRHGGEPGRHQGPWPSERAGPGSRGPVALRRPAGRAVGAQEAAQRRHEQRRDRRVVSAGPGQRRAGRQAHRGRRRRVPALLRRRQDAPAPRDDGGWSARGALPLRLRGHQGGRPVTETDTASVPVAILAGGRATRLGSLTETVPKAMVDVAGQPFIDHQLALLRRRGLRRAVLCLGHLGEQVQAHLGDGKRLGMALSYSFDGPSLLGTAGALRRALPLLGETCFVMYGDAYLDIDYGAMLQEF